MNWLRALHVEVQDALHQLAQQRRVTRQIVSGRYLYTAMDRTIQRRATPDAPQRGSCLPPWWMPPCWRSRKRN